MNENSSLSWACINVKEHIWVLGVVTDNMISYDEAMVSRREDGSWEWRLTMHLNKGIESSCDEAKWEAERALWKTGQNT